MKGLDVDVLEISHIQVNQAQKQRRRTYRAHGRINREFPLAAVLAQPLRAYQQQRIMQMAWVRTCSGRPSLHPLPLSILINQHGVNTVWPADVPLLRCPAAYMSCPCHIELTLSEKGAGNVKAEPEEQQKRLTKVQAARRLRSSGAGSNTQEVAAA